MLEKYYNAISNVHIYICTFDTFICVVGGVAAIGDTAD